MRWPNDIFCLIWKRWAGKDELAHHINLPATTVSSVLTQYCQQHNIEPTRNALTELGNTLFDWNTLANHLTKKLPSGWIITWLRKPETLYHLMKHNRCLLVWVLADDMTRWKRVCHRWRAGDVMPFLNFLDHEKQENSPPNKQNIDLLLAFCDIHITNDDTIETLIKKWHHAFDIARTRNHLPHHIDALWYQHFSRAILTNEHDEILVLYDANKMLYTLPWWKVDTWETPDITIQRELQEEIGISPQTTYCGSFPWLFRDGLGKWHFFAGKVYKHDIHILEPLIHTKHLWIHKDKLEDTLGYSVFVDTGLYHYTHNKWVKNWWYMRDTHREDFNSNMVIQYLDTQTNIIHTKPRMTVQWTENPYHIPLRIVSLESLYHGYMEQWKRHINAQYITNSPLFS